MPPAETRKTCIQFRFRWPFSLSFAYLPICPVAQLPIRPFAHLFIRPFAHLPICPHNETKPDTFRSALFSFLSSCPLCGGLAGWLAGSCWGRRNKRQRAQPVTIRTTRKRLGGENKKIEKKKRGWLLSCCNINKTFSSPSFFFPRESPRKTMASLSQTLCFRLVRQG